MEKGHRPMVPLRVFKSTTSTVRIMAVPFTIGLHDEMIQININTNTYKQMKFCSKYK